MALTDSRHALSVALPFGQTDAETLSRLARHAASLGIDDLRLAPKRSLIALCPSSDAALALRDAAQSLSLIVSPTDPRLAISACPGAPACASGHFDARALAAGIAEASPALLDGSVSLHVSGCAKGCAHPAPADLTLVGSENGIGLVVAGTARSAPLAYNAIDDIKTALARVDRLIAADRSPGENASAVLARLGQQSIAAEFGTR